MNYTFAFFDGWEMQNIESGSHRMQNLLFRSTKTERKAPFFMPIRDCQKPHTKLIIDSWQPAQISLSFLDRGKNRKNN